MHVFTWWIKWGYSKHPVQHHRSTSQLSDLNQFGLSPRTIWTVLICSWARVVIKNHRRVSDGSLFFFLNLFLLILKEKAAKSTCEFTPRHLGTSFYRRQSKKGLCYPSCNVEHYFYKRKTFIVLHIFVWYTLDEMICQCKFPLNNLSIWTPPRNKK